MSTGSGNGDRTTCTACRGTGRLLSALGGDAHEVTCPWCGGDGAFQAGRDAQAAAPADPGGQPAGAA